MKPVVYTAYSYVRLSSKRQLSKNSTGQERQESKPEAICKRYGWNLSPKSFKDLGVSAFKGKNRLQGDLAAFIQLAKDTKLGPQPLLIIEAFDRWSRQDIDESETALLNLLKSGVAIHVAFSNKTFTVESTKSLVDRIEILVSLKAAHEYSANLSSRVKSAKERKRDKIINGEVVTHNNVPKYFTFDEESQTYGHNDNTKVVTAIVDDYLAGNSLYSIATKLNEKKTSPFRYGSQWSATSVRSVLRNKALIGEFMGNPKFLPKIIEKEKFARVQVQLNRNKGFAGQTGELMNIFRGVCFCTCGKAMSVLSNSKDYRTKKKWKTPYRYLRCSTIGTGKRCDHKKVIKLEPIEDEFFGVFLLQDPRQMLGNTDNAELKRLKAKLTEHQSNIDRISDEISTTLALTKKVKSKIAEFAEEFDRLEAEREKEKAAIDELNLQISAVTAAPTDFKDIKKLFKNIVSNTKAYDDAVRSIKEDLKDNELRKKLRVLLPSQIGKIVVDCSCDIPSDYSHDRTYLSL